MSAYRSPDPLAVALAREKRGPARVHFDPAVNAFAFRVARTARGAVRTVFGLALFVAALAVDSGNILEGRGSGALTAVLVYSWPIGWSIWGIAWLVARRRAARAIVEPAASSDVVRDVASIEADEVLEPLRRLSARLRPWSMGLAAAGTILIVPLSLHWLFAELFMNRASAAAFDEWIGTSVRVVGIAHLAAILYAALLAFRTRHADHERAVRAWSWGRALLVTTLASLFPGALLLGIPVVLVAITGLVVMPLAFHAPRHAVLRERAYLFA